MPQSDYGPTPKQVQPQSLKVAEFYKRYRRSLGLRLVSSRKGFEHPISEPTVNRPGLALAGFYEFFAKKRIQVIGHQEYAYLESLRPEEAKTRFSELCSHDPPCIVVCRNLRLADPLVEEAERLGISVFQTTMRTMSFINTATIALEDEFAPSVIEHGVMIDVRGIGVLIKGKSGTGKTETGLGLIERGHSLVADDAVHLRVHEGREIVGKAMNQSQSQFHMEVRGLGIVNVVSLYGIAAVRLEKRLDLVVWLEVGRAPADFERVGAEQKSYTVLGRDVPLVELPVLPGRDMAQLVEVAALDQKLRSLGHNSALLFTQRLARTLRRGKIN